ncbi:Hint domain-containing protein [Roseovarius sp. SCSIO 43702]|uniref:Hint domain-containing protein n=1 Tax=Roseovarius sp. SCSIO 43702 TaxID=2823043 RepID=UPI001C7392FF|nr:Hint domain-containing protein [Roseovarius sp. SCSIO 43702]QYX55901.1 Hint domain-containing protein [Roseovarius sp. SCSIO 43702]
MPFLYIYSPSDFVGGLPAEQGAQAAGTPVFTLQLRPGATGQRIEVSDNESVFDEVDATQGLAAAATVDGTTWAAGTTINTAYDLINTANGHKVTSFHFGGDGYQQGAVHGLVSTVPLQPGQSYTFNTERTSHRQNNLYDDYVACFTPGTMIDTPDGARAVETLEPGDLVLTRDHGAQVLRARPERWLSPEELAARPRLRPVRIGRGSLGAGLPRRDLLVSPQHRMMVASHVARRLIGTGEVLVPACRLAGLPGIEVELAPDGVTYTHLVLDRHEIVAAEGAPTESFYPGPVALAALPPELRAELATIFPDLASWEKDAIAPRSRPFANGYEGRALVKRHRKSARPLLETFASLPAQRSA